LLNKRHVIGPAVLSRALLELSAPFLLNANSIVKWARFVSEAPPRAMLTSDDLERMIIRALFGTNIRPAPSHLEVSGIGAQFKLLSPGTRFDPYPAYQFLCDIAHPNGQGFGRFAVSTIRRDPDGSEVLRLDRSADGQLANQVREKTLFAIGWASVAICNAFAMNQAAIAAVLARIRKPGTA
jgi:hypothetical protein